MDATLNWKPKSGQKITRVYAWVAEEPDGGEGILTMQSPSGRMIPLIGADRARVENYQDLAEDVAGHTGYPVRLKVFSAGTVIDTISRPNKSR